MKPHPRTIRIDDYNYELPKDQIALFPLANREDSKLLFFNRGQILEKRFQELPDIAQGNFHFVFNDTRVVHARLIFQKATGGLIEIFCLEPLGIDIEQGLSQSGSALWRCLVGGAKKWKPGELIMKSFGKLKGSEITLFAKKENEVGGEFNIWFSWLPSHFSFVEVLDAMGKIPLPPYLQRDEQTDDELRYQTVFAKHDGSVAAPTAGLHFTPGILENLAARGNKISYLTLHVGAGTFKPVSATTLEDHEMHREFFSVTRNFLESILDNEKKIIAVGTTSLRTLESLYWIGVKILNGKFSTNEELILGQWEVYEIPDARISKEKSLEAVLRLLDERGVETLHAYTSLLIAPAYSFRVAQGLITNFHLPKSTLLLLISALAGPGWKKIYDYALKNDFRFLSYGDSSLILP